MNKDHMLRKSVEQEYKDKLENSGGSCAHRFEQEFGYTNEELEFIPAGAQNSSFGCANPLSLSSIKPGDTVLDLGSGAGMDVILAARKVGVKGKVIGVDMTGAMIDKARQNINEAGLGSVAEIRKGIIESLPVESNSVDWVISNCVVSLSPDKEQVFAEVCRVLKPGGKMLITDLVTETLPYWLTSLARLKSPASAKALDRETYLATIARSGLNAVSLQGELVYDKAMIMSLLKDELNINSTFSQAISKGDGAQVLSHCLKPLLGAAARATAEKVSSIKVYGEKPYN